MKLHSVLAVILFLTACSPAPNTTVDTTADIDIDADGSMEVTTDEGTAQTAGEVPSDWPEDVPPYSGATVQYSVSITPGEENSGEALVLMTTDSAADVAAFYNDTLVDNGWDIEGTMQSGPTTIIAAAKDNRKLGVSITETEEQTMISLGIEVLE